MAVVPVLVFFVTLPISRIRSRRGVSQGQPEDVVVPA
jgi:hypothetical protein